MADQVATLIRLHEETVAEHVLGFLLALGDLETQPGAKIYGLLVSAIVARAFLPAVPASVPAFSDTRVEAVA